MQLDNHYTSDQVVEMITLIGFFNMINRLALVLEVAAGPGARSRRLWAPPERKSPLK